MPRRPRYSPPGVPLHIVQRGLDRQPCFRAHRDFRVYLNSLQEYASRYDVEIHAYVLMTNHVHLLVSPIVDGAASKMMQQLGRQYVQFFNHVYERTGTLWDGRFKSSLNQSDRYLLACYRYIEMNPVRAGIVRRAHQYRWSSYRANAFGEHDSLLTPHRCWLGLGPDSASRKNAYARLFSESGSAAADEMIRTAWRRNAPMG